MGNKFRTRAAIIKRKMQELNEVLTELQANCPHNTSVYQACGSTGNWDREVSYWYDMLCYDCGKRWSHDQDRQPSAVLAVKKIIYEESPEVIEAQIHLEQVKKRK